MAILDQPVIFNARVMHKRLLPKVNAFQYGIYYVGLPLASMTGRMIANALPLNRFGLTSFRTQDHGHRDHRSPQEWAQEILRDHDLHTVTDRITLIAMPRILGYVFNPVSFWLCFDTDNALRAVICEVNNTFGETHGYICAHDDRRPITKSDVLGAEKLLHVSPFLKREGSYRFRFDVHAETMGVWIDFYNDEGDKQLITALNGTLTPLTKQSLRRAFWTHPLVTFKAITLIHWQAVKLIFKGVKYVPKPQQKPEKQSQTHNLK